MPISCHFRDCKALLFESRKQRYNKYPDLYLFTFIVLVIMQLLQHTEKIIINIYIFICFNYLVTCNYYAACITYCMHNLLGRYNKCSTFTFYLYYQLSAAINCMHRSFFTNRKDNKQYTCTGELCWSADTATVPLQMMCASWRTSGAWCTIRNTYTVSSNPQ